MTTEPEMVERRRAPEVFARSNGHEWANWEFKSMSLVCCNLCGIVRRADDSNKPCRGKVRIALRSSLIEGDGE